MQTQSFQVLGMTCGGCEKSVEFAAKKVSGIVTAKADKNSSSLNVSFEGNPNIETDLKSAIEKLGYQFK